MDQDQGRIPNEQECAFHKNVFISALFLTGSAAGAERSILAAIRTISSDEMSGDALLDETLKTAVAESAANRQEPSGMPDFYSSTLPLELRNVLLLPEDYRRCFVLRLLIGLSLSECSRLLALNECEVQQNIASAALALAVPADQADNACRYRVSNHAAD